MRLRLSILALFLGIALAAAQTFTVSQYATGSGLAMPASGGASAGLVRVTSPMTRTGSYVSQSYQTTDPALAGRAILPMFAPVAGDYTITANVDCADGASNSFFVDVDAEPTTSNIWHILVTTGTANRTVTFLETAGFETGTQSPAVWTLAAGSHLVHVYGRETNAQLYSLTLVNSNVAPSNIAPTTITGNEGVAISQQFTADGNPTLWTSASLPSGLALGTSGYLSGTPVASGTASHTINAINATGTGSQSVSIAIGSAATVPGIPTIGTASALSSSAIAVSFTAPASNGGATIIDYTATASPGGATGVLTQAGSGTVAINGLSPSTAYTASVRARNSVGYSTASGTAGATTTAASGPTYYIDYASGSDTATGTSSSVPWKTAPGMANESGSRGGYSHAAGDRFIFKGGVTWPRACFQWSIPYSGSSDTVRDYYGVDATWYSGGSWTRPVFDFEENNIASNYYGAGVLVSSKNYITIDNIELKRLKIPTGGDQSGCANICLLGTTSGVIVQNCLIKDWVLTDLGGTFDGAPYYSNANYYQQDKGGGGLYVVLWGGSYDNKCLSNEFTQSGVSFRNGYSVYGYIETRNNACHDTSTFHVGGGPNIAYNTLYNLGGITDSYYHPNGIYATTMVGNIFGNVIYDTTAACLPIYVDAAAPYSGATCKIYNNVIYSTGYPCISSSASSGDATTNTLYIFNNTLDSSGTSACIRLHFADENASSLMACIIKNNHFMQTTGAAVVNESSFVTTLTQTDNLTQTLAQAATDGANSGNLFKPTSGSAIDGGTDLSAYFSIDRVGVTRPVNSLWDIGAYEQ